MLKPVSTTPGSPRDANLLKFVTIFRTAVFFLVIALLSLPFALVFPLYRFRLASDHLANRVINLYLQMFLVALRWLCGVTWEVRAAENIPHASCLLASQHQSFWENMFFPYIFGNPAFFAKKEIFSYPFAGTLVRRNGHIFTDRTGDLTAARDAIDKAVAISKTGRNILIYPAGTRHGRGHDTMKSGVGLLYTRLNTPCVPIRLNTGDVWPAGSWLKYPGHIIIDVLPPIPAGLDRLEFMQLLAQQLDLKPPKNAGLAAVT